MARRLHFHFAFPIMIVSLSVHSMTPCSATPVTESFSYSASKFDLFIVSRVDFKQLGCCRTKRETVHCSREHSCPSECALKLLVIHKNMWQKQAASFLFRYAWVLTDGASVILFKQDRTVHKAVGKTTTCLLNNSEEPIRELPGRWLLPGKLSMMMKYDTSSKSS